jgi:hypothetical protein
MERNRTRSPARSGEYFVDRSAVRAPMAVLYDPRRGCHGSVAPLCRGCAGELLGAVQFVRFPVPGGVGRQADPGRRQIAFKTWFDGGGAQCLTGHPRRPVTTGQVRRALRRVGARQRVSGRIRRPASRAATRRRHRGGSRRRPGTARQHRLDQPAGGLRHRVPRVVFPALGRLHSELVRPFRLQ